MNVNEALATLRITKDDNNCATYRLAFEKLARRYPSAEFPERYATLVMALTILEGSLDPLQIAIKTTNLKEFDFGCIASSLTASNTLERKPRTARELSEEMVRCVLLMRAC